jgi:Epoxide hydrolase N terminus
MSYRSISRSCNVQTSLSFVIKLNVTNSKQWGVHFPDKVEADYLKQLADYSLDIYNWRERETVLNQCYHFKTEVDGADIHFITSAARGRILQRSGNKSPGTAKRNCPSAGIVAGAY